MKNELRQLSERHGFTLSPPAPADVIAHAQSEFVLPHALCELFGVANGLQHEWFRIPPLHDPNLSKRTWDSLQRMNDPEKSKFLRSHPEAFNGFTLFAELSGSDCAAIRTEDGSIWFSQDGVLNETSMSLIEFIETCLREVDEL